MRAQSLQLGITELPHIYKHWAIAWISWVTTGLGKLKYYCVLSYYCPCYIYFDKGYIHLITVAGDMLKTLPLSILNF